MKVQILIPHIYDIFGWSGTTDIKPYLNRLGQKKTNYKSDSVSKSLSWPDPFKPLKSQNRKPKIELGKFRNWREGWIMSMDIQVDHQWCQKWGSTVKLFLSISSSSSDPSRRDGFDWALAPFIGFDYKQTIPSQSMSNFIWRFRQFHSFESRVPKGEDIKKWDFVPGKKGFKSGQN